MAQGDTKNVGTIAALWVAATAPTNTKLIWYDTANSTHRTYNTSTGQWDALTPQSVTNITLSALTTAAQSGLPIGKFYYLTDIGTLAIAITQTKIWYVDVHSNYVVNDLVASIQSYVNSTNLLIDGVTGVWDAENGRLLFNFTEQTTPASLNKDKDYILMHRNNSGVMSWVKTKLANLISNVSGNSISWNNGLFFSANSYISSVKDESGGVVGYDSYLIQIASIEADIDNLAADNNAVRQDAYNYTDSKVTPTEIYGKQLPSAITPSGSPSQPIVGWSLKNILNDIYGWVNKFKYGNNISIGANFNTNGVPGDVNQSDNITNAFQKIVYKLKNRYSYLFGNHITIFDGTATDELPWVNQRRPLLKGDDIATTAAKLKAFSYLPTDWNYNNYSNTMPGASESHDSAIGKICKILATKPDVINESSFHGNDVLWKIRNNVMFIRMPDNSYSVDVINARASILINTVLDDGTYYKFEDIFANIPITYIMEGSNYEQKFIQLFSYTDKNGNVGFVGLAFSYLYTDSTKTTLSYKRMELAYRHSEYISNNLTVDVNLRGQIVPLPLSF